MSENDAAFAAAAVAIDASSDGASTGNAQNKSAHENSNTRLIAIFLVFLAASDVAPLEPLVIGGSLAAMAERVRCCRT